MKMKGEKLCPDLVETTEIPPTDDTDSNLLEDATPDESLPLESEADNSWEKQLDELKQKIEELQENYDQSYLEIGRVLIQARDAYKGHGDWIKWLKENVPFSVRHAQRLIRVSEMFDGDDATLVSQLRLTSSKAYALTRISKNDLNDFLEALSSAGSNRKSVENMTKRELELEVTIFLRGKLVTPNHEEAISSQGRKIPEESIKTNLEKLKEVLSKTIASIKRTDLETRNSWVSELEELCLTGLDELTSVPK